jgi:hypothetical protein
MKRDAHHSAGTPPSHSAPEHDPAPNAGSERRSGTHWSAYLLPESRGPFTWQADGAWDDGNR